MALPTRSAWSGALLDHLFHLTTQPEAGQAGATSSLDNRPVRRSVARASPTVTRRRTSVFAAFGGTMKGGVKQWLNFGRDTAKESGVTLLPSGDAPAADLVFDPGAPGPQLPRAHPAGVRRPPAICSPIGPWSRWTRPSRPRPVVCPPPYVPRWASSMLARPIRSA